MGYLRTYLEHLESQDSLEHLESTEHLEHLEQLVQTLLENIIQIGMWGCRYAFIYFCSSNDFDISRYIFINLAPGALPGKIWWRFSFFPKTKKEERKKIWMKIFITLRTALSLSFPFFYPFPLCFWIESGFFHFINEQEQNSVDCLQTMSEGSKHEWKKFKLVNLTRGRPP